MIRPYVIENLIPLDLQEELKDCLKNTSLWYHSQYTSGPSVEKDPNDKFIKDGPQIVHEIINENEIVSYLSDIVFSMCKSIETNLNLTIDSIIRIKANMLFQNTGAKNFYHPPHVDSVNLNHMSAVYYVEDSDGDTLIFNKTADEGPFDLDIIKKISPKQGSIVIFPSKTFHASKNPINHHTRTIVNFILEAEESKVVDLFYS